jgi:hypothetical protein
MSGMSDTSPNLESPSLGSIVGGLATDVQELVRGEIRLARAEIDQKLGRAISGAAALIGGALLGFAGFVELLQGGALYLSGYMPIWGAFMAVGAVFAVIGAVIARTGMTAISLKNLSPDRTGANLRKDAGLIKEHT